MFDLSCVLAALPELSEAGLPSCAAEGGERSRIFVDKPTLLITARVHPGETPASFVVDGT